MKIDLYYIWSNEHRAWWRANHHGYTANIEEAGLYNRKLAMSICKQAKIGHKPGEPMPELPVREADVAALLA